MLDRTAIVTALVLGRRICRDCLVSASGLLRADVQLALVRSQRSWSSLVSPDGAES